MNINFRAEKFAVTVQISQDSRFSAGKYTVTAVLWKPMMPSLKEQTRRGTLITATENQSDRWILVMMLYLNQFISYFNNRFIIKHLAFIALPKYNLLGF